MLRNYWCGLKVCSFKKKWIMYMAHFAWKHRSFLLIIPSEFGYVYDPKLPQNFGSVNFRGLNQNSDGFSNNVLLDKYFWLILWWNNREGHAHSLFELRLHTWSRRRYVKICWKIAHVVQTHLKVTGQEITLLITKCTYHITPRV